MVEMTATFLSLTLPGEQAGGAHQEKHCEPRLPFASNDPNPMARSFSRFP
jgi:hypothetical protein